MQIALSNAAIPLAVIAWGQNIILIMIRIKWLLNIRFISYFENNYSFWYTLNQRVHTWFKTSLTCYNITADSSASTLFFLIFSIIPFALLSWLLPLISFFIFLLLFFFFILFSFLIILTNIPFLKLLRLLR